MVWIEVIDVVESSVPRPQNINGCCESTFPWMYHSMECFPYVTVCVRINGDYWSL